MALRFYQEPKRWEDNTLTGDEARHAIKVLRVKVGEEIELFDGTGQVATAKVSEISSKTLLFERNSSQTIKPLTPQIRLYQAIPKGKTMELIIQKAVELGVGHIQPVITQNTVSTSDSPKKVEKWRRVALEASKQCKQAYLPVVEPPIKFNDLEWGSDDLKLVASLRDNSRKMKEVFSENLGAKTISIIVGPEGDFTDEEIDSLEIVGFKPVSMGELTLRVETATLYGISGVRFFY